MPILFAWDFHGVLEQDNEYAVLESTNQALLEHGYTVQATQQDIIELYGLPWGDYFRKLIPGIDDTSVKDLVTRCRELGRPAAGIHCKPRVHAHSTLKKIKEEGHTNIIVSNSTQSDLEFFMKIIMIGDTENDILAGYMVNATTYLVQNGDPRPTRAHHTITDLRKVLKEITECDHKQ